MKIPAQLQAVREDIAAGKRRWAKIKTLLSWFGRKGRGKHVVQGIQESLEETGLFTEPEFSSGGVHDYIEFRALPKPEENRNGQAVDSGAEEKEGYAEDGDDGRPGGSSVPAGSKFCIGMLEAANRPKEVLTISRDKTVEEAITMMLMHRFSQLPVTQDQRRIDGMISWRSIGRVRARGDGCEFVRECLEDVHILHQDAPFFEAVDAITEREVVLVRGRDRAISGIVTTSDLSRGYHEKAAPFLLLEEVEDRIRALITRSLSAEEIQKAGRSGDMRREVEDASDLTFGEYVRLLESKKNWKRLGLRIDRKLFIALLEDVREVRNDVVHFRPDSSEPENLGKVRMLHCLLEQVVC